MTRERPSPDSDAARPRVLVVDDEPSLIELVEQVLAASYEVVGCASPRAALARVAADAPFDVVLFDFAMPELDGVAFHDALVLCAPTLAGRCVLMTGGGSSARSSARIATFPGPCLMKPFSLRSLREVVRTLATPTASRAADTGAGIG